MIELDFSFDNPDLTRIEAAKGKPGFVSMPSKSLPGSLKTGSMAVYKAITGSEMDLSTNTTLSIKFDDDGSASAVYCPTIYRVDGELAIRWGKELVPLMTSSEGIIANPTGSVEFELDSARIGGWDDTLCLSVVVEDEGEEYAMNFPLRFMSIADKPSKKVLANLLKKSKIDEFKSNIAEAKQGDNEPVQKFSGLPAGVYLVYETKPISVSFGDTYIVRATNSAGDDFKLWSPEKLTRYLQSGMQTPIDFTIVEDPVSGSRRYDIVGEFKEDDSLDMSWLS